MIKNENYDWHQRLCRQVKESIIPSFHEVIEYDNFEKDKEIADLIKREDEFECNIKDFADIVIAYRPKDEQHVFVAVNIDDLGEDEYINELHYSKGKSQLIMKFMLNQTKFVESFFALLDTVLDTDILVANYLNLMKETPFPYPAYKNIELTDEFNKLRKYAFGEDVPAPKEDKLIKNFHPSIYRTRIEDNLKCAAEAWMDETLSAECIRNRLIYKNQITPEIIRDGFNIAKIAPKPSVFITSQAIDLFNEYTDSSDVLFDPKAGFGGKLLAALVLGRKYVTPVGTLGDQREETNSMLKWFAANMPKDVDLNNIILENCMPFPFDKYNNGNTVIVQEITKPYHTLSKTHAEFADKIITDTINTFDKCKKYVFICKDTNTYKDYVIEVNNKRTHLYSYTTKLIVITK